jgi:hypothetical protein
VLRFGKNTLLLALAILISFLPRIASAHTLGLSTAAFDLVPASGRVQARFVFSSAEPLGGIAIDRDHDGVVTDADVQAAREDLRVFLADGVDVSADGSRCPGSFVDAVLSEVDGLVLTSSYACPHSPSSVEVVLYYLSALPPGHREVVRVAAGSSTAEAVLTGERRAITLDLSNFDQRVHRRGDTGRKLLTLTIAFAVLLLSIFAWRRLRGTAGHSTRQP